MWLVYLYIHNIYIYINCISPAGSSITHPMVPAFANQSLVSQLQAVQEQAKDGGNAARYEAHQCIPKDAPPMRFISEVNSTCMT